MEFQLHAAIIVLRFFPHSHSLFDRRFVSVCVCFFKRSALFPEAGKSTSTDWKNVQEMFLFLSADVYTPENRNQMNRL